MLTAPRVLLLGALIFVVLALFLRFQLSHLDDALQRLASQLAAMLPQQGERAAGQKIVPQLLALAAAVELRFRPAIGADAGAILALRAERLRATGVSTDGEAIDPQSIAIAQQHIEEVAALFHASLSERGDGWILGFRQGEDIELRAVTAACLLQRLLAAVRQSPLPFAMAMDMEPSPPVADSVLRERAWLQSCDATFNAAQQDNELLLTRLALCQTGINERVQVKQDEHDNYQVSHYCDALVDRVDEYVAGGSS